MNWIRDTYKKIFLRIMRNRSGYTDDEIAELKKTKWLSSFSDLSRSFYWFKVEMVKTNRCTAGWKQGDCLYFDPTGMLIKRKLPNVICPHAIAALSPIIYACWDRIGRGSNPADMLIDHISCTDPGFANGGLGNNLMKITYERMPLMQNLLYILSMTPHLFFYSSKARGSNPPGFPESRNKIANHCKENVDINRSSPRFSGSQTGSNTLETGKGYHLSQEDQKTFFQSKKRIKKISGIEKFKSSRIAVEIVNSEACIAGHGVGEKFYFDSMGRLLVDDANKPICSRLLNNIWYRVIMLMDRIADDTTDYIEDGKFPGEIIDIKMACYGADFPYGDCGRVFMKVFIELPMRHKEL